MGCGALLVLDVERGTVIVQPERQGRLKQARHRCSVRTFVFASWVQNGLVGRYLPSSVMTARSPPSGSGTFWISSLKLIALMMPSPNFS